MAQPEARAHCQQLHSATVSLAALRALKNVKVLLLPAGTFHMIHHQRVVPSLWTARRMSRPLTSRTMAHSLFQQMKTKRERFLAYFRNVEFTFTPFRLMVTSVASAATVHGPLHSKK